MVCTLISLINIQYFSCIYWLDTTNNCAYSIKVIVSSSHNQTIVPDHKSRRGVNLIWITTRNSVLFSWYFNACKMLPVNALTTWPRSCFVGITSHFFPLSSPTRLLPKDLPKVCHIAEAQFRSFQQQSVVKHFKWKLICDLHGQWGENELMKCCKWNIRQGAVGESRQRW